MSDSPTSDAAFSPGPTEWRVRDALSDALGRAVRGEAEPTVRRAIRAEPRRHAPAEPAAAKRRPISFNAAMARALLAGNKTQTRRPIRPGPVGETTHDGRPWPTDERGEPVRCDLAVPGERLWVREPWADAPAGAKGRIFEADFGPEAAKAHRWRPGRFLARDASRLTLVVTQVVPQRVQAITPYDAAAEGLPPGQFADDDPAAVLDWFRGLWDSIYAGGEFAWGRDPWVWVVRFRLGRVPAKRRR